MRFLLKSRKQPAYRARLKERLGFWPNMPTGCFWVHAVSVGETIAAKGLITHWQQQHPDIPVLVTTMTPTGSDTVCKLFGNSVHHAYLPWDLNRIQQRLVKTLAPKMLIIMETELWPNLIHACAKTNTPVLLANARLSEKSNTGYQKFSALTLPMLNALTGIAAQHSPDADRFAQLGISDKKIQITGSIKFDIKVDAQTTKASHDLRKQMGARPIWVAASTHEGEEEQLLKAHALLKIKLPDALLVLVPRHPERADRIAGLLHKHHLGFARRSLKQIPKQADSVFLVDTLGELMTFFDLADAAFIGNTLNQGGGHNPIEPAALATPVVMGPSCFNFQSIVDAMRAEQAVIIVQDENELKDRIAGLLQSKDLGDTYGQRAYLFFQQQQGALKRLMAWIEDLLQPADKANTRMALLQNLPSKADQPEP